MTRAEVRSLLHRLSGEERLIATLLYGAGMRLLETRLLKAEEELRTRPPNTRLQRTPSASPPSPLSRKPLGDGVV